MAKVCAPNIRVNAVAPGLMLTEWADGFSQEQIKASEKAALLGHISPVEDVAMAYSEWLWARGLERRGNWG